MNPHPAQYLLRFDDLCPTMDQLRWQRFEQLIHHFQLRPILAVVPRNQDPELALAPADPDFWPHMRALQNAGATIALHGFTHVCGARGSGFLPLHPQTEFAGVPLELQRQWIRDGLSILRSHGLDPQLFVAPRHGFDRNTLTALQHEGIAWISDGFARRPFPRLGINWLPQQLWAPVAKDSGLWTLCLHSNTASDADVDRLRAFLSLHAPAFTSFASVTEDQNPKNLSLYETLHSSLTLRRVLFSRARKRWRKRRKRA